MPRSISLLRPTGSFPPPHPTAPQLPLRRLPAGVLPSRRCSSRRLKLVSRSMGGDRWKLPDIDKDAVQEKLNSWLSKARVLLDDVAVPIGKRIQGKVSSTPESEVDGAGDDGAFFDMSNLTVDRMTPNGELSLAAAVSIEQFGRMNGLTGRKMQKIFEAMAPEVIQHDGRCLVEYCCFRYLSRDSSDIHPSLKDVAFQKLIFITMLAWEQPYSKNGDSSTSLENSSLKGKFIQEDAFVRIAPAIAGVANISTAHHLYKALAGNEMGISLPLWISYIAELFKVHEGRKSYKTQGNLNISSEQLLCMGASRKRPVIRWQKNMAWPGNLTLTDTALYFEAIGLTGPKELIRLDLSVKGSKVERAKVGPLESRLFDSAVAVTSGSDNNDCLVLEFIAFGGETRRDVWFAFISEIISVYEFIGEYGPDDKDPSMRNVYGARGGKRRAIRSVGNSIARLQALQALGKLSDDPGKLVQFSYLQNAPFGDIVLQTLAVNYWAGPLISHLERENRTSGQFRRHLEEFSSDGAHVYDLDGSAYLRKWMKSPSWSSSSSINFWKNVTTRKRIVLSRKLVVADLSLVERAALMCKKKSKIVEKTQASIDAAMIKGIPSNIDLFKELMLPFMIAGNNFEKLRRWEDPRLTLFFLLSTYTVIFRNLLSYVLPAGLMILAFSMLLLKTLKEQGRLGRSFGRVTIRDQPPSNTIQTIIAVKETMADVESYLQNLNISLLKVRTVLLSGQPEITNEVAILLLLGSTVLILVPFKFVLSFVLLDLFTRELEFRQEMVKKFMTFVKEKWAAIYAAPVVVLPYEGDEQGTQSPKGSPNKPNRKVIDVNASKNLEKSPKNR